MRAKKKAVYAVVKFFWLTAFDRQEDFINECFSAKSAATMPAIIQIYSVLARTNDLMTKRLNATRFT